MGEANILCSSHAIPWFTNTIAFHIIQSHVSYHLRRRNGDDTNRFLIDACCRQPVTQPYIMCAAGKCHSEGYFLPALYIFYSCSSFVHFLKTNQSAKIF